MSFKYENEEFVIKFEESAHEVVERVNGPAASGSGNVGELVSGGVQESDALKRSKVNVNDGEYVGSNKLINGDVTPNAG